MFVENCGHAGKTTGEVMSGIVAKCIAAPRTKTKDLALQVSYVTYSTRNPLEAKAGFLYWISCMDNIHKLRMFIPTSSTIIVIFSNILHKTVMNHAPKPST